MNKIIIIVIISFIIIFISMYMVHVINTNEIRIKVSTTTSLYATGLLDYLISEFRKKHPNIFFDFIPVGSGEALKRAEYGEVCMVFVHAPSLEKEYIEKNIIINRTIFAYNYFIIAGPPGDPGGIRGSKNVVEAFMKIYRVCEEGRAKFVSRGDNSGTNIRELIIWSKTGLDPRGKPWYIETGSGMSHTLLVANEEKAYVLSDISTYLKLKKENKLPDLEILYSNDTELINIYSIYIVSSCSETEKEVVQEFIEFIMTRGQEIIADYGVKEYGQRLFNPAKNDLEWLEKQWEYLSEDYQ